MSLKDIQLGYGPASIERGTKKISDRCRICGKRLKRREDRFEYEGVTMCKQHANEAFEKAMGSCVCPGR